MPRAKKYQNVPTVSNLVAAGDPVKIARAKNIKSQASSHLSELNDRIDEIENAIGQDKTEPVGRAFAIRAETNRVTKARPAFKTDADLQKSR